MSLSFIMNPFDFFFFCIAIVNVESTRYRKNLQSGQNTFDIVEDCDTVDDGRTDNVQTSVRLRLSLHIILNRKRKQTSLHNTIYDHFTCPRNYIHMIQRIYPLDMLNFFHHVTYKRRRSTCCIYFLFSNVIFTSENEDRKSFFISFSYD